MFLQKVIKEDVSRSRLLLLLAAAIYPLWGLVIKESSPNVWDPLWLRMSASLTLMLIFTFGHRLSNIEKNSYALVNLGGGILSLHSFWLCWINSWSYEYVLGLLVLAGAMLTLAQTRQTVIVLSIVYLSFFGLSFFHPASQVLPALLLLATISVLSAGLIGFLNRKAIFHELQAEENRNKVFFKAMREGAVIQAFDGRIVWHNEAALNLLGLTGDQLSGKTSTDPHWNCIREDGSYWPGSDHPAMTCLQTGRPELEKIMGVFVAPEVLRWLRVSAVPIQPPNETKQGVLATFVDVTELKKQSDQLNEQQSQLEMTARMNALGEMAAGIAHEINNPLTIIGGTATLLKRAIDQERFDKAQASQQADRLISTVHRIGKIVQGMKNFARDSSRDSFEVTSVNDVIDDIFLLYSEKIQNSKVQVDRDLEPELYFSGRSGQIQQVLVNLLQNSLDAIEMQKESAKDPGIGVRTYSAGDSICIEISDNGPGVPEAIRKKIMQPFFTTKVVGRGTGLGLSISLGLVKNHGGTLELIEGLVGSTFRVTLPRVQAAARRQKAA